MAGYAPQADGEVINLISDSEEEAQELDNPNVGLLQPPSPLFDLGEPDAYFADFMNWEEPQPGNLAASPNVNPPMAYAEGPKALSEEECVQLITNVLAGISLSHVLNLVKERKVQTVAECERLITVLLDNGSYPKESDEARQRKRKRKASEGSSDVDEDATNYTKGQQPINTPAYRRDSLGLLKQEFLSLQVNHIEHTFREKKTLFATCLALEAEVRQYNTLSGFPMLRQPRRRRSQIRTHHPEVLEEFQAARRMIQRENAKHLGEEEERRLEEANVLQAELNGELNECLCCYETFPINRMVPCTGRTVHFVCRTCAKTYVEEELGKLRCRPVCFADTACGGTFLRSQLVSFLSPQSFERLEHLQQQEDLIAAGLGDLDGCPFCDFKAECPPVEVDREFRCENPKCGKTSCRLCNRETHIPMSCEEASKDDVLLVRHKLEEAKSDALIRKCNKCKNPFIKELGCNKMTCTKCGNKQCYVCSENIVDYKHFSSGTGPGKCPLHDNQEARHEEDIKQAEEKMLVQLRAEHPDIPEEDLKIKLSASVEEAEKERLAMADARNNNFGYHMDGDHLRARVLAGAFRRHQAGRPMRERVEEAARMLQAEDMRRRQQPVPRPVVANGAVAGDNPNQAAAQLRYRRPALEDWRAQDDLLAYVQHRHRGRHGEAPRHAPVRNYAIPDFEDPALPMFQPADRLGQGQQPAAQPRVAEAPNQNAWAAFQDVRPEAVEQYRDFWAPFEFVDPMARQPAINNGAVAAQNLAAVPQAPAVAPQNPVADLQPPAGPRLDWIMPQNRFFHDLAYDRAVGQWLDGDNQEYRLPAPVNNGGGADAAAPFDLINGLHFAHPDALEANFQQLMQHDEQLLQQGQRPLQ